jgi:NAD(P)-dependent dehydrogenase (short-subunit alcohol dehydrogenase family)
LTGVGAVPELFSLAGRTALVTGASTAIGREIAVMLAGAGADVVVSARSAPALERAAGEIRALGRKSTVLPMDLADIAAVEAAPHEVEAEFGALDIVVNAAGATYAGIGEPSVEATEQLWDRHFDVNLKASFFLARSAARLMLAAGSGKIVNIASTFSFVGVPAMAAYCASKGGVVQLTRALATEWAPHGINVNGVAPGAVLTEISEPNLGTEQGLRTAVARIPAGRLVTAQDVAAAVLYLSAPASNMVHGHTLVVDGGTIVG